MNAPDPGRPEDGAASLRRALHATAGELAPPPYPAERVRRLGRRGGRGGGAGVGGRAGGGVV
ncbi:hypothetical protein ACWGQZ_30205, partial [Streptomyces koyangensis]